MWPSCLFFRQVCGSSSRLAAWDWLLGFSLAVRPVEGIIPRTRGCRGPEDPVGFQRGDSSADLGWRLLSNPLSCGRGRDRPQGLPDARAWSCQLSYDCSYREREREREREPRRRGGMPGMGAMPFMLLLLLLLLIRLLSLSLLLLWWSWSLL